MPSSVFTHQGAELDAHFEVHDADGASDVVFHARYGGKETERATNTDYFPALEVVLARLAELSMTIEWIAVDSSVARELPEQDRLLDLQFPIELRPGMAIEPLRLDITRAERDIARDPDAKPGGGNNHKRIRIRISPPEWSKSARALERRLSTGT